MRNNLWTSVGLWLLLVLYAVVEVHGDEMSFPKYSYREHPIYQHAQFRREGFQPLPVVMRRYTKRNFLGLTDTEGMMFSVGKAKYVTFDAGTPFGDPLDALYTPYVATVEKRRKDFIEVQVNLNVAVYLVMVIGRMEERKLVKAKTITGLNARWGRLRTITTTDRQPIKIGSSSRGTSYELPGKAYVVESYFSRNETIFLPTSRMVKIDGKEVIQLFLLFGRPKGLGRAAIAYPYPETPISVTDLVSGRKMLIKEAIRPNEQCPDWLHDLYKAKSRDFKKAVSQNELQYWRTWHAMVDPVYWCYFDHEHGCYPGKYQPLFDYTPWKTPDASTPHGRQIESDQGFKVFSLPLHEQRKFVIITVHMHCSEARRFYTRHHTGIFAVLDENWKLLMELQMKMDFGFGVVSDRKFNFEVMNKKQKMIWEEMGGVIEKFRRFNVLNLDDYPNKVDQHYRLRRNMKPTLENKEVVAKGIYERWAGSLNTCQICRTGILDSFSFDVRDVATGKKRKEDSDYSTMTRLSGSSVNRVFATEFSDILIGTEYCRLKGSGNFSGLFYTDPYFTTVYPGHSTNRIRQFVVAGFETVVLPRGKFSAVDAWAGHFERQSDHTVNMRSHSNVENAVVARVN